MSDINEALRESEERYRTLFEQAPIGVYLFDRDLRITACNARFVQILRSSHEQLIGLDMRTVRDQGILPALERTLTGEVGSYEGRYQATTSDAAPWVSIRMAPLRDAHGVVLGGMGVVEDITEHVRAAAILRESEQRRALYVKQNPLGVVVFDEHFRIAEWNDSATRIFGWTEAEALGKRGPDLLVPEEMRASIDNVWTQIVTRTGGERNRNPNVTKDGRLLICEWYSVPLFDERGAPVGVASLVDDVTERQAAEDALKRSEARFRALIERAPDAVAVLRGGRWLYLNPQFVSYLGCERASDLIGRPVRDSMHPDDVPIHERRREELARGASLPPQEYRMMRRDGSMVTAEVVTMTIDYDGTPAVLCFARDVTVRKQMHARLTQTERMAAVGTLAAGVAHELNNPLAYVITNLTMAGGEQLEALAERVAALEHAAGERSEETSRLLSDMRQTIEAAREGAERMRSIVRDLRTFSRSDDEQIALLDVRRVLDASLNMAQSEIRHRARLSRQYEDDVPKVAGNEGRLGQVFVNLLVNAAQALPAGRVQQNVIRVAVRRAAGDRVMVEVTDNGPGIPPEIKGRLFEPFVTTKPAGEGTGLGLWICQGIVTRMGGSIEVETRPGETTFRVLLPRGQVVLPPESRRPTPVAHARRGRVLVVDDEAPLANALKMFLGDEHDMVVVTSGRDALSLLERDARFDAIICDLMMPDVTGVDVHDALAAKAPALAERMIFVTGGAFTPRMREFLDRVPNPQLEKPFDLAKLRALLRKLCV
jgi:PAS domain S-box-containing protein